MFHLLNLVCLVCFLCGGEASDMCCFPALSDARHKPLAVPGDTLKPGGVIALDGLVEHVFSLTPVTEVIPSVIDRGSVLVVDDVWPLPGHVKPCETVREVSPAVDADADIPVLHQRSRSATSRNAVAGSHKPCEYAGVGIVMKNSLEPFNRQFGHDNFLWMAGYERGLQPALALHIIEVSPWRA